MYISKFMLDNPTLNCFDVDPVIMERAAKIYDHFESNNLFYVEDDKERTHVLFDGDYVVEISRNHLFFRSDVDASAFYEVRVGDVTMIKHGRHLKPVIYHPIFNDKYVRPVGEPSAADYDLLTRSPNLTRFCIYNRNWGWSIDLTDLSYPMEPIRSVSMHTVKMCNWFKDTHKIISLIKTRHFGNRITQFRFIC